MDENPLAQEYQERKEGVGEEFFHWLKLAEQIVDANYETDSRGARSALICQVANSLMLQHKLGEIEWCLDYVRLALENPSWS